MSTVKELSVEMARTYNLGNYESTKIAMALTLTVAEGDNVDELKAKAAGWLSTAIKSEFERAHGKRA